MDKLITSSDEVIIISPYCFSDFGSFLDRIASRSTIKSISLMTTLRNEEVLTKTGSLMSFRKAASDYGIKINILINNRLHGKVYIFKSNSTPVNAMITSANITHNGLQHNHEWGCCFNDRNLIDNLEKTIMSTVEYNLTEEILDKVQQKVDAYKKGKPSTKPPKPPIINIDDIIIPTRYNIDIDSKTRVFLKPIGSTGAEVYDGDYSNESEQYFAVRPKAVRKNDVLISYAVGARKIISIFKVLSDVPNHTGNDDDRWPWYVDVENITPKFGKVWYEKNLYITELANSYVESYDLIITNNGGQTLGALQWGVDKIWLAHDFGTHLMSLVMPIEEKL